MNNYSLKLKKFYCDKCDYSTSKNSDFKKHLTTRIHRIATNNDNLAILGNVKVFDISLNHNCVCCNYNTSIKTNYDKHLLTEKHKKNVNGEPIEAKYNCSQCSKEYLNYNALWKHKKHCVVIKEREPEP
jgi:hypothetical protein